MKMETFLDIIKNYSALIKLDVMINFDLWEALDLSILKRLLNEHSSLIVLDLRRYKLSITDDNNMTRLINQHKSLQELRFQIQNLSKYDELSSNLSENR